MQWELAPEGPLFLFLLAQGCPGGPAPVPVQAAFLLRLLLGYTFLLVPLIDDFLTCMSEELQGPLVQLSLAQHVGAQV